MSEQHGVDSACQLNAPQRGCTPAAFPCAAWWEVSMLNTLLVLWFGKRVGGFRGEQGAQGAAQAGGRA